jgi:23S rRNA A2030 N6-methylase RlmJ
MKNLPDADVEDYLLQVAEKNPDKIISLYTGSDTNLRLLFIDARDKKVIVSKNKIYCYGR